MAAHIGQPTRSRRFIKLYLSIWALLASGALAYLAVLAFPPSAGAPPPQASVEPGKDTSTEVASTEKNALTEVRSMQGSLSEIRKDVSQLQEVVGERVINEKVVETRLNALEERVSTIDGPQDPPATPQPPETTPLAKAPVANTPDKSSHHQGEPQSAAEPPFKPVDEPSAATAAPPPAAPIETGSIAPKIAKAEIVFGAPVVTRTRTEFAVQLAASPSLKALRQSWGQLSEQHAEALAALQPRVIAPRAEGGVYRLLAGPVATKADAERICTQVGGGPKACFATQYAGAPL